MNKTHTLSDDETIVEFFSSHTIKALKKKKARRRLVIAVLAIPKILAVLYVGVSGLIESHEATAADEPVTFRAAPFVK